MKVAIEGCAHGELDNIYDSIKALEDDENIKVDLLICCGDFQSVRNEQDLRCMAIPPKYYNMCTFYKYYGGEKKAPILTIFIGGNHEASNYLQELPFGGWVAPNIYYLGYGNVINIGGLRIGGISGIYKGRDYMKGHYEMTPYSEDSKRSVYHIRNLEVFRLKQVSQPVDIFLSHDWPNDITKYGDEKQLLKFKPFFKDDIESGKLGSPPCTEIMETLKPKFWFSAHLHCKFAAMVEHKDKTRTKFLALDKCLPNKRFLQILDIPHDESKPVEINYDLEWLTILYLTDHLFSIKSGTQYMPSGSCTDERSNFKPTDDEKDFILEKFDNNLKVPHNFKRTANVYTPESPSKMAVKQPPPRINPQTTELCSKLGITDPSETLIKTNGSLDLSQLSELDTSEPNVDSDASFVSTTKSPIKRLSLHLPKPVNEPSNDDDDGDNIVCEVVEKDSICNEDEKVEEPLEDIKEEETNQKPLVRKLKRRNAEMYENNDD